MGMTRERDAKPELSLGEAQPNTDTPEILSDERREAIFCNLADAPASHQTLVEACNGLVEEWRLKGGGLPAWINSEIFALKQALENTARDSSKDGKGWIEDPPPPIDTES